MGDQSLFADPAALKVEVSSMAALCKVNARMEHTLVVSPRLGLTLVDGSSHARHLDARDDGDARERP